MTDPAPWLTSVGVAQVAGVQIVLVTAIVAAVLAAATLVLLHTRRDDTIDLGDLTFDEADQSDEDPPDVALADLTSVPSAMREQSRPFAADGEPSRADDWFDASAGPLADLDTRDAGPGTGHVPSHRGARQPGAEYTELSRSYAALGRAEDAALAQWAADLRLVRPLIGDQGRDLPERVLAVSGRAPIQAVKRARTELLKLVAASEPGWPAPPMFASLRHVSELPCSDTCTAITTTTTPGQLRDRAVDLMSRATEQVAGDAQAARSDARRSDLAALDAVLLESAQLYGDRSLASVELRRQLASLALHDQDQTATSQSLSAEIARTRAVLRAVVEPHELDRLESSFAPEPAA